MAFSLPAAAQTGSVTSESSYLLSWPETDWESGFPSFPAPVPLGFGRMQAGRVLADDQPDVLVMRTSDAVTDACLLPNLGSFDLVDVVAHDCRDATLLVGAGPAGRDAVLVLDPDTGLDLIQYTGTAASGEVRNVSNVRSTSDWKSATRVWSVARPGGSTHVFAANAAGSTLLRLEWNGSTFTDQPSVAVIPGTTEVLGFDFDGAGAPELLAMSGPHLLLLAWDGTYLGYMNSNVLPADDAFPAGARRGLSVSRGIAGSTNPAQRDLACVYTWRSDSQTFQVFAFNSGHASWSQVGGLLDPQANASATTSGDYDGDGLGDLVLASSSNAKARLLRRTGGATAFESSTGLGWVLGASDGEFPAFAAAAAAVVDLDGDGDQDVLWVGSPTDPSHSRARHGTRVHRSAIATGRAPSLTHVKESFSYVGPVGAEHEYQIDLVFTPPAGLAQMSAPAPTHGLVQAWIEHDALAPFTTSAIRAGRVEFALAGSTQVGCTLTLRTPVLLDTQFVGLHLHASTITKTGASITKYHPSALTLWGYAEDVVETYFARHNLQLGVEPPVGGSGGDGSTTGSAGGAIPPGGGASGRPTPRG
ncbi:MAG: VCBS repeat-containing protein [Planctomycetes bacterium]|nr:VCBS repeat-containing protein [Planctomycetota bacterium]